MFGLDRLHRNRARKRQTPSIAAAPTLPNHKAEDFGHNSSLPSDFRLVDKDAFEEGPGNCIDYRVCVTPIEHHSNVGNQACLFAWENNGESRDQSGVELAADRLRQRAEIQRNISGRKFGLISCIGGFDIDLADKVFQEVLKTPFDDLAAVKFNKNNHSWSIELEPSQGFMLKIPVVYQRGNGSSTQVGSGRRLGVEYMFLIGNKKGIVLIDPLKEQLGIQWINRRFQEPNYAYKWKRTVAPFNLALSVYRLSIGRNKEIAASIYNHVESVKTAAREFSLGSTSEIPIMVQKRNQWQEVVHDMSGVQAVLNGVIETMESNNSQIEAMIHSDGYSGNSRGQREAIRESFLRACQESVKRRRAEFDMATSSTDDLDRRANEINTYIKHHEYMVLNSRILMAGIIAAGSTFVSYYAFISKLSAQEATPLFLELSAALGLGFCIRHFWSKGPRH